MRKNNRILIILIALILITGIIVGYAVIKENTVKSIVKGASTNFEAGTSTTQTINGITYQIDTDNNSATVLKITEFNDAIATYNPGTTTACVNIPESIGYTDGSTTKYATVKYLGDGSNGIFDSNFMQTINFNGAEQLVLVLNKSLIEVRNDAITGYGNSDITKLRIVALSNDIEFKAGSINTKESVVAKVVTVPGTKTDAIKGVSNVQIVNLYDIEKNSTNKTITIKGFNPGNVFQDTCDTNSNINATLVNVRFPEKMTIDRTEYTVTKVAEQSFDNNTRLKNIIIPTTVETIGNEAFAGCENINYICFLNKNIDIGSTILFSAGTENLSIYGLSGSTAETFAKGGAFGGGEITFKELKVNSLRITKQPSKTEYNVGDTLNTSGLELNATFTGTGISQNGTITKGYTVTPETLSTAGTQTITVDYEGAKTTFNVNVKSETISEEDLYFELDPNGGAVSQTSIKCEDGGSLPECTKEGYRFIGWAKNSSPNTVWCAVGDKYYLKNIEDSDKENGKVKLIAVYEKPVNQVSLNKTKLELVIGGTETLVASIEPEDATYKNVTWSSDDENVATVDQTGMVTGVKTGVATITVTTEDGNKTATCEVTIKESNTGDEDQEDKTPPTITKVEVAKDDDGNKVLYITVSDEESGIEKVTVNGENITSQKTSDGKYYYELGQYGKYEIVATDKAGNKVTKVFNWTADLDKDDNGTDNEGSGNNNGTGTEGNTLKNQTPGSTSNSKDLTTISKILPNTGSAVWIIAILAISGFGIFSARKYKKFNIK